MEMVPAASSLLYISVDVYDFSITDVGSNSLKTIPPKESIPSVLYHITYIQEKLIQNHRSILK